MSTYEINFNRNNWKSRNYVAEFPHISSATSTSDPLLQHEAARRNTLSTLLLSEENIIYPLFFQLRAFPKNPNAIADFKIIMLNHGSVARETRTMKKQFTVSDGKLQLTLEVAEEGGYIVTSPLDPELITEAESVEEAFVMARDALKGLRKLRAKHRHKYSTATAP